MWGSVPSASSATLPPQRSGAAARPAANAGRGAAAGGGPAKRKPGPPMPFVPVMGQGESLFNFLSRADPSGKSKIAHKHGTGSVLPTAPGGEGGSSAYFPSPEVLAAKMAEAAEIERREMEEIAQGKGRAGGGKSGYIDESERVPVVVPPAMPAPSAPTLIAPKPVVEEPVVHDDDDKNKMKRPSQIQTSELEKSPPSPKQQQQQPLSPSTAVAPATLTQQEEEKNAIEEQPVPWSPAIAERAPPPASIKFVPASTPTEPVVVVSPSLLKDDDDNNNSAPTQAKPLLLEESIEEGEPLPPPPQEEIEEIDDQESKQHCHHSHSHSSPPTTVTTNENGSSSSDDESNPPPPPPTAGDDEDESATLEALLSAYASQVAKRKMQRKNGLVEEKERKYRDRLEKLRDLLEEAEEDENIPHRERAALAETFGECVFCGGLLCTRIDGEDKEEAVSLPDSILFESGKGLHPNCVDRWARREYGSCAHCDDALFYKKDRFSGKTSIFEDDFGNRHKIHVECRDGFIQHFSSMCIYCSKIVNPKQAIVVSSTTGDQIFNVRPEDADSVVHRECFKPFQDSIFPHCQQCGKSMQPKADRVVRFENGDRVHWECRDAYVLAVVERCVQCSAPLMPIQGLFDGRCLIVDKGKVHAECWGTWTESRKSSNRTDPDGNPIITSDANKVEWIPDPRSVLVRRDDDPKRKKRQMMLMRNQQLMMDAQGSSSSKAVDKTADPSVLLERQFHRTPADDAALKILATLGENEAFDYLDNNEEQEGETAGIDERTGMTDSMAKAARALVSQFDWAKNQKRCFSDIFLASLYVREAMAERQYWTNDIRERRIPALESIDGSRLSWYNLYHHWTVRLLFGGIVIAHCGLALWEQPHPALVTFNGQGVLDNGCNADIYSGFATPSTKAAGIAVICFTIVICLDLFLLMYCLDVRKFLGNSWNLSKFVLTMLVLLDTILIFGKPGVSYWRLLSTVRPWLLVVGSKTLRNQFISLRRTAGTLPNFLGLLVGFLTIGAIFCAQASQAIYTGSCCGDDNSCAILNTQCSCASQLPTPGTFDGYLDLSASCVSSINSIVSDSDGKSRLELNACCQILDFQHAQDFPSALLAMIVLITGENYPDVMAPAAVLFPAAIVFYIFFFLFGSWVLMSVLLAVMFDGFKEAKVQQELDIRETERLYLLRSYGLLNGGVDGIAFEKFRELHESLRPNSSQFRARLLFEFLDVRGSGTLDLFEFFKLPDVLRLDVRRHERLKRIKGGPFKYTKFGRILLKIVNHTAFELGVMGVILLNVLLTILQTTFDTCTFPGGAQELLSALDNIIILFFLLEMLTKQLALGRFYFRRTANVIDMSLVIVSIVPLFLDFQLKSDCADKVSGAGPIDPKLLRVIRMFRLPRLLRMFTTMKSLRVLTLTFISVFRPLASVTLMLLVVFYSFSSAAVTLFGCRLDSDIIPSDDISTTGFRNLLVAALTNFQMLTRSNWHDVMYSTASAVGNGSVIYFVLIIMVMSYFMLNIVVALVIEAFQLESSFVKQTADVSSEVAHVDKVSKFKISRVGDNQFAGIKEKGRHVKLKQVAVTEPPVFKVRLRRRFSRELVAEEVRQIEKDSSSLKKIAEVSRRSLGSAAAAGPGGRRFSVTNLERSSLEPQGFQKLTEMSRGVVVQSKDDYFQAVAESEGFNPHTGLKKKWMKVTSRVRAVIGEHTHPRGSGKKPNPLQGRNPMEGVELTSVAAGDKGGGGGGRRGKTSFMLTASSPRPETPEKQDNNNNNNNNTAVVGAGVGGLAQGGDIGAC